MEPFKNVYNQTSVTDFSEVFFNVYANFDQSIFKKLAMKGLRDLEMKARVVHIAESLREVLPNNYRRSLKIILKAVAYKKNGKEITGFMIWPLTYYVESYGGEHFSESMESLKILTCKFTSEFAIRKFIELDDKAVFLLLKNWVNDSDKHIRRLCSEGIRPNLPWGIKVSCLNTNLKRNISILNLLENDEDLYVRKSVANHLNDISRIDPDLYMKTIEAWSVKKQSAELQWVIKHSARSLLKLGDPRILKFYKLTPDKKLKTTSLSLSKSSLKIGEEIELEASIESKLSEKKEILLQYVIYFLRKNGEYGQKVFFWKRAWVLPKQSRLYIKKIKLKKVSTRKYYTGVQKIAVRVNGQESKVEEFNFEVQS